MGATAGRAGGESLPSQAGARTRRRWLLFAAALLAAFVILAVLSRSWAGFSGWDRQVHDAFVGWRDPVRSRTFWLFTLIGNGWLMAALTTATVVLLWAWGRRAFAAAAAGGFLLSWGLTEAAKALLGRPRPLQELALIKQPVSQSMPSAHAVMSVVLVGLLVHALLRWSRRRELGVARGWRAACAWAGLLAGILVVGSVGVSRVYLGVHWLSDVFAGWCLGGAFLIVAAAAAARWERSGSPGGRLRTAAPWAAWARWTLAGLALLVVCGAAVAAGRLAPLR